MWDDLQVAARTAWRRPRFAVVAVVSIALGIGANTTIFGVLAAVRFRPLPYERPERIVVVRLTNPERGADRIHPSLLEAEDLRAGVGAFRAVASFGEVELNLGGDAGQPPARLTGAAVSAGTFDLLGVRPAAGRGLVPADDAPGAAPVALLSHALWDARFGADRGILGRTIRVNGIARTVVGIMPPGFRFPEVASLWVPLGSVAAPPRSRAERGWETWARLAEGATPERAAAEAAALGRGLAERHPETNRGWAVRAVPLAATRGEDAVPLFLVLMAAVGAVLLIACGNLASFLLARGVARRGELAVRAALGASRPRLVRQVLAESLLLAAAGGAAGVLLSLAGTRLVRAALAAERFPFWLVLELDWRVLAFAVGATLATGLAFGILPALRLSRADARDALSGAGRGAVGGRRVRRLTTGLMAAETALALALLSGAGFLVGGLARIRRADPGYDYRGLLTAVVDPLEARYRDPAQRRLLADALMARLERLPGVRAASAFAFQSSRDYDVEGSASSGAAPPASVPEYQVTPAWFRAMRIPLRAGRDFQAGDRPGAPEVAIVNEELARRLWPGQAAVGRRLRVRDSTGTTPWLTVVGVVGNVRRNLADLETEAHVYRPAAQEPPRRLQLVVRTAGDPLALAPAVERAVRETDPDQPLTRVMTMEQQVADWLGPTRFFALALGAFAALALALASLGVYGTTAYAVAQRTRELGVRLALGSSPAALVGFVLRTHLRATLVGLAIGLAASAALAQVIVSLPFGVERAEPWIVAAAAVALASVALLATYLPARRAASTDPMLALRAE